MPKQPKSISREDTKSACPKPAEDILVICVQKRKLKLEVKTNLKSLVF